MNAISEARRARNLSLEDVARTTCIGLRHVRAIDEGRLADLPPGIYARAWVRAVAAVVKVDGAALDEILAPLTPAPDPLPALEEVRAARAAAQPRGDWAGHAAVILDAVMLLALNGCVVALAAEACGASPRHIVTMTPVPLFVLCATTWLVYFFLLAGIHGCTAGQFVCGLSAPRDGAPLTLSAIARRAIANGPGLYATRWSAPRWIRGYAR